MKQPFRIAIQQRVLASYRVPFFETLAEVCEGVSVFAGQPRPEESIAISSDLKVAHYHPAHNFHLLSDSFYFCYQHGLIDWLSTWDPDVLIVEANPRYISTPFALNWMKRRGRPVLGWGLGAPPLSGPLNSFRASRRYAFLRQFDGLFTYSRQGLKQYAALGIPEERIFVAPNAATPPPSHPMPVRPDTFRGRPCLLFVGRLQARKRIDLLLHACASLADPIRPRLVIVGDGPERTHLEALAAHVFPSAEFVGAKHGTELVPYFLAADLFILPGTGGLAVQEAMSWGLPVIMGQGDGTNDDLVRPENGWQIGSQVTDPAQMISILAEIISSAVSDVAQLRRLGRASYRIVAEEINLDQMAAIFMKAINSVLQSRSGRN